MQTRRSEVGQSPIDSLKSDHLQRSEEKEEEEEEGKRSTNEFKTLEHVLAAFEQNCIVMLSIEDILSALTTVDREYSFSSDSPLMDWTNHGKASSI